MTNEVLGPKIWVNNPEIAANIMVKVLGANYGRHNITNNKAQLVIDIKDGNLLPWIREDETACAALIKQSETAVEIGRVACMPGFVGGKSGPILAALESWKESEAFPESEILRAEIRTAKPTKEVPGGQATQTIFLDWLKFLPTAIGPFFHHGIPDRQEMFMLANLPKNGQKINDMAVNITIPEVAIDDQTERKMLIDFWQRNFENEPNFVDCEIGKEGDFLVKDIGPFVELTPSQKNDRWTSDLSEKFQSGHRFGLAKLNLTSMELPDISRRIIDLRQNGFNLVGFEPVLRESKWSLDLLMGKLSNTGRTNLVMPSFSEGVVPHKTEDNLLEISINWRRGR